MEQLERQTNSDIKFDLPSWHLENLNNNDRNNLDVIAKNVYDSYINVSPGLKKDLNEVGPINVGFNEIYKDYLQNGNNLKEKFPQLYDLFKNHIFFGKEYCYETDGSHKHISGRGEALRSKSEVIIADSLAEQGIFYEYEKPLLGTNNSVKYPDFTINDPFTGKKIYWEHLGMMDNQDYKDRWQKKLEWYRNEKILPINEGYGENGLLIITSDDSNGGIDSREIKSQIKNIFKTSG